MAGYVIDVCAIMNLQGYNEDTCLTRDPTDREVAWSNLEILIQNEQVVTVYAARSELERRARECFYRLKPLFSKFIKRDTAGLIIRAGEIREQFPTLVRNIDSLPSDREPADPYIIAYGEMHGATVVTDEKLRRDRTHQNRAGDRIPDVCEDLYVDWLYLQEFAAIENLL